MMITATATGEDEHLGELLLDLLGQLEAATGDDAHPAGDAPGRRHLRGDDHALDLGELLLDDLGHALERSAELTAAGDDHALDLGHVLALEAQRSRSRSMHRAGDIFEVMASARSR